MDPAIVHVGTGQQDSRAHQFQMQPRRGRTSHVRQPFGKHLSGTSQLTSAQARRLRGESFGLVGRDIDESGRQRVRHRRDDHQVPQPPQQILGETLGILADLDHLVDTGEHPARIAGGEGVHELVEQRVRGVAQQRGRLPIADTVLVRPTEELIED